LLTNSGKYDKRNEVWYINTRFPDNNKSNSTKSPLRLIIILSIIINPIMIFVVNRYLDYSIIILVSIFLIVCLAINSLIGVFLATVKLITDIEKRDGVIIKL
jgi:hypothetical protein